MNTTTLPKFQAGEVVKGRHAGAFVVYGAHFCEAVGEWLYEVRQLGPNGQQSKAMNLVESCFA